MEYYKSRNLGITTVWECELKAEYAKNPDFRKYMLGRIRYWNLVDHFGHADIKESFFGGRTNNIKFYHKCSSDEEIKYMDVNSLYPYVLKNKEYPIGHPIVINENFDLSLESHFGFIKCRILPPRDLYIPVLPTRVSKKLVFTLCKACTELEISDCTHNEYDRSLIGTWTSIELQEALKSGYKILDLIEVLHYPRRSSSIFSGYINKFLKIKHESSGWPHWCTDATSKKYFIQQVKDREGIELDPNNMVRNPALRFIAKLFLNSLWGKLAQNPDKKKTEIIHNYDSYFRKITDDQIEIVSEIMVNDKTLIPQWKNKEETLEYGRNTSLAIASFVTSYARLELYHKMAKVESIRPGSLLYFDTDSIIYYRNVEDLEIECGDHLGELKDEICADHGPNASIQEFVTCGPKNYAYKVSLPDGKIKTTIKTKGITLNEATLQFINYEHMLKATKQYCTQVEGEERVLKVPQFNIHSDSHHNLQTRYFSKAYQVVSKKRIVNDNSTFPYGFQGDRTKYC